MTMSDTELVAYTQRAQKAAMRGYQMANSKSIAAELMEETGLTGFSASSKDIVALCRAALQKREGKPTKVKTKTPVVKKAEKKASIPAPAPSYEDMSRDDLYEEAKIRNLEGRSEMNKADLVEALKRDDEGYTAWTRGELYEEAKVRDIEGRSEMNKSELIEALKASD